MSFVLSWSGYFSRKRWNPKDWATANNITSYDDCVRVISKMHVRPPSREQFDTLFVDRVQEECQEEAPSPVQPEVKKEEAPEPAFVKTLKKEQKKEQKKAPVKPKPRPRRRTTKKTNLEEGSGTASIIDSVKKKTTTRRSRSRKNVKS